MIPAAVLALAAFSVPAADSQVVRLYTNADLGRFASAAPSPVSEVPHDSASWAYVREFIDREHERIDATRRLDLERRRVEIEAKRPVGYGAAFVRPIYDRYGFRPQPVDGCRLELDRTRDTRMSSPQIPRPNAPLPAPVPIHAR